MSQFFVSSNGGGGTVTSVSGGNNITITGTPTIDPIVNVSGTTNHSLLLGNSLGAISNLGVATNGQLPIGSTGADPVLGNLTSMDGSITITNGAGTIDLSASGSSVLQTLTGNTGGAISPVAGNINILGTGTAASGVSSAGNLYISGTAGTLTLNETQAQFLTNITHVDFSMTPYTVTLTDYFLAVDTSGGAITILLPAAAGNVNGRMFIVKDTTGDGMTNNITVTGGAGTTVDFGGTGENIIDNDYESFAIGYDLANTNYMVY